MSFDSTSHLLIHPSPCSSMAGTWLESLFGPTPWQGSRTRLWAKDLPEWIEPKIQPRDLPYKLSLDWGDLRMVMWRDNTAVLVECGQEGWDVAPMVLFVPSELWGKDAKGLSPDQRDHQAPRLIMRGIKGGMGVDLERASCGIEEINALLYAQARERLNELGRVEALCDPRAYPNPPEGTRFAPFSPFPEEGIAFPIIDTLAAGARLAGVEGLELPRQTASSPWRKPRRGRKGIFVVNYFPQSAASREKATAWIQVLGEILLGKNEKPGLLPSAAIYGQPDNQQCWKGLSARFSSSAHGALEARAVLLHALGPELYARLPQS